MIGKNYWSYELPRNLILFLVEFLPAKQNSFFVNCYWANDSNHEYLIMPGPQHKDDLGKDCLDPFSNLCAVFALLIHAPNICSPLLVILTSAVLEDWRR